MEHKEIIAIVDKEYKFPIIIGLLMIFSISIAVVSELQEHYPNLDIDFLMILFFLGPIILFAVLIDEFVDLRETITANFQENQVVLIRGKQVRMIPYTKIKKAVKYMIINRTYQDKGKYRVLIKCYGRNYVMYSGENSDLKLDFEATEVSKIYFELKRRGIMCC